MARRFLQHHWVLAALAISGSAASAAIISPAAAAGDGYHHNELGTSNDFFDGSGDAVAATYYYAGTSATLRDNRGFAQISLAPFADQPIQAVSLHVYMTSAYKDADSASAGNIMHIGNSSAATGNASQKLAGADAVATIMPGAVGWAIYDVTSYVLNDLTQGYAWAAFSFNPTANGGGWERNAGFSFASAEGGNPVYLSAVVPEPSSALLVAVGGFILATRRRAYA